MARKVINTCDRCERDIEDYHHEKSLAFLRYEVGVNGRQHLTFYNWDEDLAAQEDVIHFDHNICAKLYLEEWLGKQQADAEKRKGESKQQAAPEPAVIDAEYPEVPAAPPVQVLDKPAEESAFLTEKDIPF